MRKYIIIQWPEVQVLMDNDWFQEEAILIIGREEEFGSFAYFIPEDRLYNVFEGLDNCFDL